MSTTSESRGAVHASTMDEHAADPTRSFADPGPLGLAAFALTTFLLSLFNA